MISFFPLNNVIDSGIKNITTAEEHYTSGKSALKIAILVVKSIQIYVIKLVQY